MCGGIAEDWTEEATRTREDVSVQAYHQVQLSREATCWGWLYIFAWIFPPTFRPLELPEGKEHLGGVARDAPRRRV